MDERPILHNLPMSALKSHPDNPRKDLGDLSELTESIRKNGIMQNLTVIPTKELPGGDPESERYTILIGHRRFAAGKAAGLDVFPCRIVRGLSHSEQVALMLEENIQRTDLTVIEQAEGMQMLLDLGESYETIKQKTGFSESTIRHRVNLLKIDREILEERQHQLTIKDFQKLESIPVERRDEALKGAQSSQALEAEIERIKHDEEQRKAMEDAEKMLSAAGYTKGDFNSWEHGVKKYCYDDPEIMRKIEENLDGAEAEFVLSSYSHDVYVRPIVEEKEDEPEETDEDILKRRLKNAEKKKEAIMDDIVKSESKRLADKLKDYLRGEEFDYDKDMIVEMAEEYMNLDPDECIGGYNTLVDSWEVLEDVMHDELDEFEKLDPDDMRDRYTDLNTGAKILFCAIGLLKKPYGWDYRLNIINRLQNEFVLHILKYLPFQFSPEMKDLIYGNSNLYKEITEENLDTWEEEFK